MGNGSSKFKEANENVSYTGASNAINQFNGILEMEPNKEKRNLNFTITSTESSISLTKENVADLTRKLTVQQERLQQLEATLADVKDKLVIFNSSKGGTRKKTLNKNNRKTRTSLCKKK